MSSLPLETPRGEDDVYVQGGELSTLRAILTGDVFCDISLPEHDEPQVVMLIAHPCSMRRAAGQLADRIPAAIVRGFQKLPFENWPDRAYSRFPLPDGLHGFRYPAAFLDEWTMVSKDQLNRRKRVLALVQQRGILILQQRFVHSLTRVVVGLDVLLAQEAHVLEEASLEEEWVGEFCDEDEPDRIDQAIADFAGFMDGGLREDLADAAQRTRVRQNVRQEIERRLEGS